MSAAATIEQVRSTEFSSDHLLYRVIKADILVTSVSGAILIAAAVGLDSWLGVNPWVIAALGVVLLDLAIAFGWAIREPRRMRATGRVAVAIDGLWVVGAIAIVVFGDVMTVQGERALLVSAVLVAGIFLTKLVAMNHP